MLQVPVIKRNCFVLQSGRNSEPNETPPPDGPPAAGVGSPLLEEGSASASGGAAHPGPSEDHEEGIELQVLVVGGRDPTPERGPPVPAACRSQGLAETASLRHLEQVSGDSGRVWVPALCWPGACAGLCAKGSRVLANPRLSFPGRPERSPQTGRLPQRGLPVSCPQGQKPKGTVSLGLVLREAVTRFGAQASPLACGGPGPRLCGHVVVSLCESALSIRTP